MRSVGSCVEFRGGPWRVWQEVGGQVEDAGSGMWDVGRYEDVGLCHLVLCFMSLITGGEGGN
jgi:hypothetical protein